MRSNWVDKASNQPNSGGQMTEAFRATPNRLTDTGMLNT